MGVGGCGTARHSPQVDSADATACLASAYEPAVASALVFDPPLAAHDAPLDLARADRRPSAFLGYEEMIAEYFYVRIVDRQTEDSRDDRYERRAISERVGVLYR